ncbi:hypothetical protein B0T09DRAFT_241629, partial [Sordaria sp. MPI-SDFR-AT-0083]
EALRMGHAILVSSEGSGRDIPRHSVSVREIRPHPGAAKPELIPVIGLGVSIPYAAPASLPRIRWLRSRTSSAKNGQSSGTERLAKKPGDGCHTRSDDMIRFLHGGMIVVLSLSHV